MWILSQLSAFEAIIPKEKFRDLAKVVTFQRQLFFKELI